jgi:energy-coupling factor transport system substrate-specific component
MKRVINVKKRIHLLLFIVLIGLASFFSYDAYADSVSSEKSEILVDLEVSGAEALCQTDDGFIWIGQYSGLTRYDSKEFQVYKSFEEDGKNYEIINVRDLASIDNTLYILTYTSLYSYSNNHFHVISTELGSLYDLEIDKVNKKLYVASETKGVAIYDIESDTVTTPEAQLGMSVIRIDADKNRDTYYYQTSAGLYNSLNNQICNFENVMDTYIYEDILYIARADGEICQYDLVNHVMLTESFKIDDQINKLLYDSNEKLLYIACEADSIYYLNLNTKEMKLIGELENKKQIIDLMIDYEGNLWLASHYIGTSGVSYITKNALVELFYDEPIWQNLASTLQKNERNVYAVEKIDDILYVCSTSGVFFYDTKTNKILDSNPVMDKVKEYVEANGITYFDFRDVEEFNNKIYFASYYIGLIEYDPITKNVKIYDVDYIDNHNGGNLYNGVVISQLNMMRCLRSFDNYLAIGYNKGIAKFDGENFSAHYIGNVLYINKANDGSILFNTTKNIFTITEDFKEYSIIPTMTEVGGNRLKFLVDGDYIYYNLNDRLFSTKKEGSEYFHEEIEIPYVKGSIVELSKVRLQDRYGNEYYKYVIGSQTQVYIVDSLDTNKITDYEFYAKTNGLQPIIANTSGYFDEASQKYYFQTAAGVFEYSFIQTQDVSIPIRMAVNSVELDDKSYYGNEIHVDKNTYRISFNLSVFGFRPNKGYTIYYKLEGVDNDYNIAKEDSLSIFYTNLNGGSYDFSVYVVDEFGQTSNLVHIHLVKDKFVYEQAWFRVIIAVIAVALIVALNILLIKLKTRNSIRRQLQLKNITLEAIQAIARTIDAKDEYSKGHSIRVGYYSKIIAEHLHLSNDEVDNIYYIALLHDIGKIALPDSILNKPGRLTDEEFAIMKSHTVRGAKILNGISTIPQIIEGAKSHHEKYDGSGYPEGLRGEFIPYVARIICCADCFDAMASKRVYKEPFALEKIIGEFERCSGTQFDPQIAKVVVDLIKSGKLKPYTAENTYLGSDGKTHRMKKEEVEAKEE